MGCGWDSKLWRMETGEWRPDEQVGMSEPDRDPAGCFGALALELRRLVFELAMHLREDAIMHHLIRKSWAKLLKRVVDLDLKNCPNCGGELRMLAAILEQLEIEKILTHLGRQARAPPRAPARGQAMQAA